MFRRKRSSSDLNRTSTRPPEPRQEPTEPQLSRNPSPPSAPHRLPPAPPARADVTPRRPVDIPGHPRRAAYATATYGGGASDEGKKLIVGRDISLSGNIAACDKLVVEGTVEADVSDARIIEVAESGTFKGNAELDEADISGRFEGGLTVRQELRVRSTGDVRGAIRYARLVVEGGGRLTGTIEVLEPEEKHETQEADTTPEPARPQPAAGEEPRRSEPE